MGKRIIRQSKDMRIRVRSPQDRFWYDLKRIRRNNVTRYIRVREGTGTKFYSLPLPRKPAKRKVLVIKGVLKSTPGTFNVGEVIPFSIALKNPKGRDKKASLHSIQAFRISYESLGISPNATSINKVNSAIAISGNTMITALNNEFVRRVRVKSIGIKPKPNSIHDFQLVINP